MAFVGRMRGLDGSSEDFAQDALLKILDNLDSFRGESRFTTWASKIAVRVVYTELRRKRWQDVSLDAILEEHELRGGRFTPFKDRTLSPERKVERATMSETLMRFVTEELTQRQREAIVTVMFEGMPLDEVARRMETNRNALYKLLHDARKRLKKRIEAEGLSFEEVLDALEE